MIPQGIDCFYENTGGPISDAVLWNMNRLGRVSVCGQISNYNNPEADEKITGISVLGAILFKGLKVQGFMAHERWPDWSLCQTRMHQWISAGQLIVTEDITNGLESAPDAWIGLFSGRNTGKAVVRI